MDSDLYPSAAPALPRRRARLLRILWTLAILMAVVNTLASVRRVIALRKSSNTPEERAAQSLKIWLHEEPANARLLLLLSHQDIGAVWFTYRLNYFLYPRRFEVAWENLPPDAFTHYDLLVTGGTAQAQNPAGVLPLHRTDFATLFALNPAFAQRNASPEDVSRLPLPVRVLLTILGMGIVLWIGTGLLTLTVSNSPFANRWANLACAHLVGATALTLVLLVSTLLMGRLAVWPVYVLAALLLPRFQAARTWLFPGNEPTTRVKKVSDGARRNVLLLQGVMALGLIALLERGILGLDWDGYAIWQFKAKGFFVDGDFSILHDSVHFAYAHMDYPLLISLQSWWLYVHFQGVADIWAQIINLCFCLDLLILFAVFARRYASQSAMLAGLALLSTLTALNSHATSGFADIPFAAYLLAMAICLSLALVEKETGAVPLATWMFVGIAHVKNEGLLACLSGTLVILLFGLRDAANRSIARRLLLAPIAMLLGYLPWLWLKRSWNLVNDVMQPAVPVHFTARLLLWRLGFTLQTALRAWARFGPWYPCWGLLVVLLPVGLIVSLRRNLRICAPLWMLAGLQSLGYLVIYLITPHDLNWHLSTSLERLTLHVVPVLLLAACIADFHNETLPSDARNAATSNLKRAPVP